MQTLGRAVVTEVGSHEQLPAGCFSRGACSACCRQRKGAALPRRESNIPVWLFGSTSNVGPSGGASGALAMWVQAG